MAKKKLTDELIKNISKALSLGLNVRGACDYAGISEPTYYAYMAQAEEDIRHEAKSKYVEFFNSVKTAKAAFRIYHMTKIREAAENGSWQASAWSLERLFPDEYGRQDKIVITETDPAIIDEVERAVIGESASRN